MIDLYYAPTYNGKKISIALEELDLEYQAHAIDIHEGDQFSAGFLAINPNNKIPAIVDRSGYAGKATTIFESGAILIYLAEKTGKLLPAGPAARMAALQWLMWQMAGVGPMFGQWVHFSRRAPGENTYAIGRYRREVDRLRIVADRHLADHAYFADEYSIADIALWPWLNDFRTRCPCSAPTPHLDRWAESIAQRPAVQRGSAVLLESERPEQRKTTVISQHSWDVLFGSIQHQGRE